MATSKTEEGEQDREVGETREATMAWAAVVEEEKEKNQMRARVASTCGGLS
jgi:cell division protein YceG involved in septum cleavage